MATLKNLTVGFYSQVLQNHGRRVNFERVCPINGQKGTNLEHSFQNNNIQKNLPICYYISYKYINLKAIYT